MRARILNCFMHLGMLEAIEIRMEIVLGNFRCLPQHLNCGFPAPDAGARARPAPRTTRAAARCAAGAALLSVDGGFYSGGTRPRKAKNKTWAYRRLAATTGRRADRW